MHTRKEDKRFLNENMTEEEKRLLDMINEKLAEAGFHLRLMSLKISNDGSISTEFIPPVQRWIKEDLRATAIIQEELSRYLSR